MIDADNDAKNYEKKKSKQTKNGILHSKKNKFADSFDSDQSESLILEKPKNYPKSPETKKKPSKLLQFSAGKKKQGKALISQEDLDADDQDIFKDKLELVASTPKLGEGKTPDG